jgi:excinuclease ABC subunit A
LSGGEAQRIKIARISVAWSAVNILDEPTTGLQFDDIAKLLAAFRALLKPATPSSSPSTTM